MEQLYFLKEFSLWGNTAYNYLLAVSIFIITLVILKIFQVIILSRLRKLAKKTKTDMDDTLIEIFTSIKPPFYFFIALYLGVNYLSLPGVVNTVMKALFLIVIVYEITQGIVKIIDYFTKKHLDREASKTEQKDNETMVKAFSLVTKIILYVIGLIMILSNLGINVTSLVASLGIGGIAIALAIQNVLGDIFSAFTIYLDKPFRIGDYVVLGTDSGVVEKIGIKSTRIRTLQGEMLVVSNKELTSIRISNFEKMEKRRVSFALGVTYGTPKQKLEKVPTIIEKIITSHDKTEFGRCYFESFGDFSLNFNIVYNILSKEMDDAVKIKHEIHLAIYEAFEKEGIDFAFPTQTVVLEK